jgi:hypothetical protein
MVVVEWLRLSKLYEAEQKSELSGRECGCEMFGFWEKVGSKSQEEAGGFVKRKAR